MKISDELEISMRERCKNNDLEGFLNDFRELIVKKGGLQKLKIMSISFEDKVDILKSSQKGI